MKPYNKQTQLSEDDCVSTQKETNITATNWNTNAVGVWIIGGDIGFHIQVYEQPTEEQIKNTQELLGWKWKSY